MIGLQRIAQRTRAVWASAAIACCTLPADAQTVITTGVEFDLLVRAMPSGDFILGNDIDMTGITYVPIGDAMTPFSGTLDGDGYAIQNLTIGSCSTPNDIVGLFGETRGALITDVHLENVAIIGDERVGALAALLQESTVTGCSVTGSVKGRQEVGGMFGLVAESIVTGSWTDVTVSTCNLTNETGKWHGGFAGHIHPHPQPGNSTLGLGSTVRQCYARGSVTGYWSVGGFAGNIHGSLVEDCFATGATTASRSITGGFTGYIQAEPSLDTTIRDSWSSGAVTAGAELGTRFGEIFSLFPGFVAHPAEGGFIGFSEGLVEVGEAGFTVRVRVESCKAFGAVETLVTSLTVAPAVGGFLGWGDPGSLIADCTANGDVDASKSGGFVGWSEGRIEDSSSHGDVNGQIMVGGFVGQMQSADPLTFGAFQGHKVGCHAYGNVFATGSDASTLSRDGHLVTHSGGFAGYMFPGTTVQQCEAHGMVEGQGEWSGGFVGHLSEGDKITKSASFGPVFAHDGRTGGFASRLRSVTSTTATLITNSFSRSDVVFVGPDDPLYKREIGGFIGSTAFSPTITNCYSSGLVNVYSTTTGGFIGLNSAGATITSSYWDTEASTQATSAGGTGLSTALMKTQSSYVGWDFTNIWDIVNTVTYPYFQD